MTTSVRHAMQVLQQLQACLALNCPRNATAVSPLLNRPLTGPVYFVKGIRFAPDGRRIRTLPTLLVTLRGEVAIDLRAKSDVEGGKLVNTFDAPDAPISRFDLNLKGGKGGIIVVTRMASTCRGRQIANAEIDGQNGRQSDSRVVMRTPCRKGKPQLRIGRATWRGRKVVVRGRVSRAVKRQTPRKRVRVTMRCGRSMISRLARPNAAGRWKATLKTRVRFVRAKRGRVITRYRGGFNVKTGTARKMVRKRGR